MIATIHPAAAPLSGIIEPPSSKNYTTRYILASCLARGRSEVHKPAIQDDAVALVRCCRQLGATIRAFDGEGAELDFTVANGPRIDRLEIDGFGDTPDPKGATVDPDNAGAVLRLLIGTGALVEGGVRFDTAHHKDSLGKRPNKDLLDALAQLGVECVGNGPEGMLPVTLKGGKARIKAHLARRRAAEGLAPDEPVTVAISGEVSSQFLSAILFLAPLLDESLHVRVTGELKSKPLIETTRQVLADAGIPVESTPDLASHTILAGKTFRARTWAVNGDWPGSAAILAAAAVVPGSNISIRRLRDDEQGERRCVEFYRAMGCSVEWSDGGLLTLRSPEGGLRAATIDGDLCTDAVLAMMGAAMMGAGESRFLGINNLQYKECDRVRQPIAELRKVIGEPAEMRAWWSPHDDPKTIHIAGSPPGFEGGIETNGCGDHRVIMLLSIVGLRCARGLRVRDVEHVAKSFPRWFETLRAMGATIDIG